MKPCIHTSVRGSQFNNVGTVYGSGASCSGLLVPALIMITAAPFALIPKNSVFPFPGACQLSNIFFGNPWAGDMVNIGPCIWRMPVARNSWNGVRMGFGLPNATVAFSGSKWVFSILLVCFINTINSVLQTWQKLTGSTPLGTYTATAGNCNAATIITVT